MCKHLYNIKIDHENAIIKQPEIPSAEEVGWKVENNRLEPIFMLLEPISKSVYRNN